VDVNGNADIDADVNSDASLVTGFIPFSLFDVAFAAAAAACFVVACSAAAAFLDAAIFVDADVVADVDADVEVDVNVDVDANVEVDGDGDVDSFPDTALDTLLAVDVSCSFSFLKMLSMN